MHSKYYESKKTKTTYILKRRWGTETSDQRGVNGSRSKFLSKLIRRPISQNHHKPSRVLGEVWNSYGRAKPTQNTHRTSERKNTEVNPENLQTWQTRTGQTALSDRSDRSGWSSKNPDRSDRLHQDRSQTKLQTANLEQTKSKSNETWRKASHLPREHIPKRSFPKN